MKKSNQDSTTISDLLTTKYIKGIYEGDVSLLNEIYHPQALLYGDIGAVPYSKSREEYLDNVKNRISVKKSGKPFNYSIVSIDVVNSIAVARLHVKMYDFNYDEFLSFHKVENRWLIVTKMLTDISNQI